MSIVLPLGVKSRERLIEIHVIVLAPALLKLINNSSSLNKGNHDSDGVWISDFD